MFIHYVSWGVTRAVVVYLHLLLNLTVDGGEW